MFRTNNRVPRKFSFKIRLPGVLTIVFTTIPNNNSLNSNYHSLYCCTHCTHCRFYQICKTLQALFSFLSREFDTTNGEGIYPIKVFQVIKMTFTTTFFLVEVSSKISAVQRRLWSHDRPSTMGSINIENTNFHIFQKHHGGTLEGIIIPVLASNMKLPLVAKKPSMRSLNILLISVMEN